MGERISTYDPSADNLAKRPEIQSMIHNLEDHYGGEFFPWGVRLLELTRDHVIQESTLFQIAEDIAALDGHKQIERFFSRLEKTVAMRGQCDIVD